MERKTAFQAGEFYHIFTRGIDKRVVFENDIDYRRLQILMYLCNSPAPVDMRQLFSRYKGEPFVSIFEKHVRTGTLVDIIAYAIMPNHFHVLIRENMAGGISRFMLKLMTAYSMYFNTKNERSGPLFTRPFRSRHVDTDDYLRWVFSYINMNPLELHLPSWKEDGIHDLQDARVFLETYPYGTYPDHFLSRRPESAILNQEMEIFESLRDLDDLMTHIYKGFPFVAV